ncbi:MAG: PRC-barrel domain-containing protein [Candidatus Aenigmarchaeota archaeon]|nr:PRC-barrel domain-containing protein [Candidatus Aenigmarchaeota archaeon]
MGVNVNSVSQTYNKDVFTDRGMYCGKVEDVECDLKRFKLRSLVVKSAKGSYVSSVLAGRRGLIVPFSMVEAVGDVVLIKHITAPLPEDGSDIATLPEIKH